MTSPLSHALANVMKRAAVISMAFIYAQRPVTPLHLFGVALSVFGTLLYQQLDSCRPAPEQGYGGGYELVHTSEAARNAADDAVEAGRGGAKRLNGAAHGARAGPVVPGRREAGAVLVWPKEGAT